MKESELEQLKKLMFLKEVYRQGEVKDRKESTAEHVYGCMIIAEHFLKQHKDLDELKVLKLIIYHDIVEIETGDVSALDDEKRVNKEANDKKGAEKLIQQIPESIRSEYRELFDEYEARTTREAQFVKAIDALEPLIHWALYHEDWTRLGWTKEEVLKRKPKYLESFPELLKFFNELVELLEKKKHF